MQSALKWNIFDKHKTMIQFVKLRNFNVLSRYETTLLIEREAERNRERERERAVLRRILFMRQIDGLESRWMP